MAGGGGTNLSTNRVLMRWRVRHDEWRCVVQFGLGWDRRQRPEAIFRIACSSTGLAWRAVPICTLIRVPAVPCRLSVCTGFGRLPRALILSGWEAGPALACDDDGCLHVAEGLDHFEGLSASAISTR